MAVLPSDLRNHLENTVKAARRQAEAAARAALERLTVGNAEPGGHLTVDERQLRNRLRAHGRQLGDQRDPKAGTQSTNRLIHECAYEHWHRMLFARFLSENHLLMHPDGVAVTLAECDELAADEGAPDGWTLAARYAARMLPQIFRPDDPVLQVGFAPEHKRGLEKLVTELPGDIFTAEDSLGWVYQFWQAERKDEVNASGNKITGETLPAVTQLFTEHYMVLFLLHNTIGAWWAARLRAEGRIPKSDWDKCQSEDDCRKLVSLPGLSWEYLRFVKNDGGDWVPAAGAFPAWPKALKLFKLLDPCCGSGHIIIAAFEILVRLWIEEEKLSAQDACDAVVRENLHGLELDQRCTQIAAFALALTAWKFTGGFRPLPPLNIACSGLGVNAKKEDWLSLANGNKSLLYGMEQLYDLFQKAPELGSLINPRSIAQPDPDYIQESDLYFTFAETQPLLTKALQSEKARMNDDLNEIGVAARGMASAVKLLGGHFDLVVTNVPYLVRSKQDEPLREFLEQRHDDAKGDLATAFVERCRAFCRKSGVHALVTPQNWLFLKTYKHLRKKLLEDMVWNFVARLGAGAFETIGGEVVNVALLVHTSQSASKAHRFYGLDVSNAASVAEKALALRQAAVEESDQSAQLGNPDCTIAFGTEKNVKRVGNFAYVRGGITTGDSPRFRRCFWELRIVRCDWAFQQGTVDSTAAYGGREYVLLWEDGHGTIASLTGGGGATIAGRDAWGKKGIAVTYTSSLNTTIYTGELFENVICVIVPKEPRFLPALWEFCRSEQFYKSVRQVNQKLSVDVRYFEKAPFDLDAWQDAARKAGPLPQPSSDDPTQSLFAGQPVDSTAPLQVAVARVLGYRWPRQTDQSVSGAPPVLDDGLEKLVDEDGIVCIPSVRGEQPAADRLRELLTKAYGRGWSPARQDELLTAVGFEGCTVEDWLRNGFFEQHCKFFHHRPFIWQVWDGRKDGFSALVNYHKLDYKLLEKLTYTYLGEWIKKQQDAVANEESGADDRLLKARQLQDKLKLILEGEAPYDIFVRWKPLDQQPIGWHPNLNDGLRLNIRPFMEADVLRKRPNIKWGIDRGKNPLGSPWGQERDNDRHLTLAEKREAKKK
jgi:hypothetical protein